MAEEWRKSIEAAVKEASEMAGLSVNAKVIVTIAATIENASKEHAPKLKSQEITKHEYKHLLSVTIRESIIAEPELANITGKELISFEKAIDVDKIGKILLDEPWWPE